MKEYRAKFSVGQMVHHRLFNYRGVVFDVDAEFAGSDEWYGRMAQSRPPKEAPWYHILVDGSEDVTYVAERNLEADLIGTPIHHPDLGVHFFQLQGRVYITSKPAN